MDNEKVFAMSFSKANNENGFSGGDLKEKALSAIITKTDTDWS